MKYKRTKEEIIQELQEYYQENGKAPKSRLADTKAFSFSKRRVKKLFGSWNTALLEANIPTNRRYKIVDTKCLQCGKPLKREWHRIQKNGERQFCSVICSNIWRGQNKEVRICPVCGTPFSGVNKKYCCRECFLKDAKRELKDASLQDLLKETSWSNIGRRVRTQARYIMERNEVPKECVFCGYDNHVECCHIRPLADFPLTSTLSEINALENLVYLCPNHHWELDNGYISMG